MPCEPYHPSSYNTLHESPANGSTGTRPEYKDATQMHSPMAAVACFRETMWYISKQGRLAYCQHPQSLR